MSILIAPLIVAYKSYLDWAEIDVTVYDDTPDDIIVLTPMLGPGKFGQYPYYVRDGVPLRIPKLLAPPTLNLVGQKADTTKVYIALNVDLANDVVLEVYAVDESGASGGGGGGQARIAGVVTIDGAPAARDVLVISDDPDGREVLATGASASDGTFDITYNGWDGAVIALAIDTYGRDFAATTPLNEGAVLHPTTPNGYVYVVTSAGTTGVTEPVWPTTGTVQSGSVTFNAQPYYRPVASGPLQGDLIPE
jgi:hypothetical protein